MAKPAGLDKAAKTPKAVQPKRPKASYGFMPSFNVASRAHDRLQKQTSEAFMETKKSTMQQRYQAQKAASFVATTQGSAKLARKQSFAEKPQHVSPMSLSFHAGAASTFKPIREKPGKAQQADLLRTICTARGLSA